MCEDSVELFGILNLISEFFPDEAMEEFRTTSIFVFCSNTYCAFKNNAGKWMKGDHALMKLRKLVLSLILKTTVLLLNRAMIQQIGGPSKNYALAQKELAVDLEQFIQLTLGN